MMTAEAPILDVLPNTSESHETPADSVPPSENEESPAQTASNGHTNASDTPLDENDTSTKKHKRISSENSSNPPLGKNCEAATKAMLKALSELETPEEKIGALCSRYADLLMEHKKLQNHLRDSSKSHQQVQKDKDRLQADYNKTLLAKGRLESLCRELQRQNKIVKEESVARSREEQTKIREVSDRFQTTISEVQTSMTENSQKNQKLKEENAELCNKIKGLIEQYEKREEYVDKLTKTKDMEVQLVEAKLKEMTMILAEEKERNLVERQKLLTDNVEMRAKCDTLVAQVEASKKQIKMYTDKFDEFQTTLTKSNNVFNNFKSEMDKMAKRIKTLEKETLMWKSKFDGANQSLVKIMEERVAKEKETTGYLTKVQKLEKLCRALQEERNSFSEKNKKLEREIKHAKIKLGEYSDHEAEAEESKTTEPAKDDPSSNRDTNGVDDQSHLNKAVNPENADESPGPKDLADTQAIVDEGQ